MTCYMLSLTFLYIFFSCLSISVPEITFSLASLGSFIWFRVANVFCFCFCFLFLLTAFLLLYDTELFRHKYLCFQYLSCLDFTACIRFVKWSCFWVGNTWTLVCKCYLNLCFILVCGMYVQIVDTPCLLRGGPVFTFPRGRLQHSCQATRRPWICPGFYFDIGRYKGERFFFLHSEDVAVSRRTCFASLSPIF